MKYQPCATYPAVAETLAFGAAGKWGDLYRAPPLVFEIMGEALREAHCFVFDFTEVGLKGQADTTSVAQFTADCVSAGIFQPPFDVSFLQWPDPPKGHWRYGATLAITLCRKGVETKWSEQFPGLVKRADAKAQSHGSVVVAFGFGIDPVTIEDGYKMRGSQRAFMQDMSLIASFDSGTIIDVMGYDDAIEKHEPWPLAHVMALDVFASYKSDVLKELSEHSRRDAGVTCRNILYYMGVLSSRGPISRSMTPDPKVVAKRAREGRAPWVSYSLISLPCQSQGHASGNGEHRSSPRQHWRRGHIRRLPTGNVTAVSPCMVGASELGKVIASYHVGQEAVR